MNVIYLQCFQQFSFKHNLDINVKTGIMGTSGLEKILHLVDIGCISPHSVHVTHVGLGQFDHFGK